MNFFLEQIMFSKAPVLVIVYKENTNIILFGDSAFALYIKK